MEGKREGYVCEMCAIEYKGRGICMRVGWCVSSS